MYSSQPSSIEAKPEAESGPSFASARVLCRLKHSVPYIGLIKLDLENLGLRRQKLMLKFAQNGIKNGKLSTFFRERQSDHPMELRDPDIYRTTKVHTKRLLKSNITHIQSLSKNEDSI